MPGREQVRVPNPYRPGFNQAPAVLAGRTVHVDAIREALDIAALDGRTPRPVVLEGPRGVGKTVLLAHAADIAAETVSWPTIHLEVTPGRSLLLELLARLETLTAQLTGRPTLRANPVRVSGGKVSAGAFGIGAEVSLERQPTLTAEPAFPIEAALIRALSAAATTRAGILLTVDEAQQADREELAQLAATLQAHVPDNWPLVVILAGLPSLRGTPRRKPPTYLERGEWLQVGYLVLEEATQALAGPSQAAGRPMTEPALHQLIALSGGYPYAVQVAGHHAWRASTDSPSITTDHVRAATNGIDRDLNALYRSRWADASGQEQRYLPA